MEETQCEEADGGCPGSQAGEPGSTPAPFFSGQGPDSVFYAQPFSPLCHEDGRCSMSSVLSPGPAFLRVLVNACQVLKSSDERERPVVTLSSSW